MVKIRALNVSEAIPKEEIVESTEIDFENYRHLSWREYTNKEIQGFWMNPVKNPETAIPEEEPAEVVDEVVDEELEAVRDEADELGISYQDNWKITTLKKKIAEKKEELENTSIDSEAEVEVEVETETEFD